MMSCSLASGSDVKACTSRHGNRRAAADIYGDHHVRPWSRSRSPYPSGAVRATPSVVSAATNAGNSASSAPARPHMKATTLARSVARSRLLRRRTSTKLISTAGSVASLAKGRCVIRGLPVHLMILRWPDGPVAMPWPRSGRTVRDRRRARRSGPRRQCRPGGRTSRPGPCAARASPRSP